MNTSLSIKMKSPDNKDLQKSITYISPEVTANDLKYMARGLVSLTSNSYEYADRVQRVNVDTESIPGAGKEQTLTVSEFETVQPQFVSGSGAQAWQATISGAYGALASSCVKIFRSNGDEAWTFSFIEEDSNVLRVEYNNNDVVNGFMGFVTAGARNVSGVYYLPTFVDFEYGEIE